MGSAHFLPHPHAACSFKASIGFGERPKASSVRIAKIRSGEPLSVYETPDIQCGSAAGLNTVLRGRASSAELCLLLVTVSCLRSPLTMTVFYVLAPG